MPLLTIMDLDFYLAHSRIIENFNLSVYQGEIITLFGPSGCGKTTLLKIISKILKPSNGILQYKGSVSYLFQEHRLFESINAYDNIALVMEKVDKKWILESLQSVGLSKNDAMKYPQELSGGMCARIAFIRSLAYPCKILLLDEPFSGLDFKMREILIQKVTHLAKQKGIAVILVTHDAYEACMLSHKILFLSQHQMRIEKTLSIAQETRNEDFLKKLFKQEFKGRFYFD